MLTTPGFNQSSPSGQQRQHSIQSDSPSRCSRIGSTAAAIARLPVASRAAPRNTRLYTRRWLPSRGRTSFISLTAPALSVYFSTRCEVSGSTAGTGYTGSAAARTAPRAVSPAARSTTSYGDATWHNASGWRSETGGAHAICSLPQTSSSHASSCWPSSPSSSPAFRPRSGVCHVSDGCLSTRFRAV